MKWRGDIDINRGITHSEIKDVSSILPGLINEVDVIARHNDALGIVWKSKTNQSAFNAFMAIFGLLARDLNERWIGFFLARDCSDPDEIKRRIHLERVKHILTRDRIVDRGLKTFQSSSSSDKTFNVGTNCITAAKGVWSLGWTG